MDVLLNVQGVTKEFSGERLFEPVSFIVRDHDRTAIIGPNGTGKSTLIKILLGQEEATSGQVIISKNVKIGYLSQDVIENPDNTLYEEALSVFRPLMEEEKKLSSSRDNHQCGNGITLSKEEAKIIERCTKNGTELHYSKKYGLTYTNVFGEELPVICLRGMFYMYTDEEIKNMKK